MFHVFHGIIRCRYNIVDAWLKSAASIFDFHSSPTLFSLSKYIGDFTTVKEFWSYQGFLRSARFWIFVRKSVFSFHFNFGRGSSPDAFNQVFQINTVQQIYWESTEEVYGSAFEHLISHLKRKKGNPH